MTRDNAPIGQARDAAAVRIFPPAVPLITILAGLVLQRRWPIDLGFTTPSPAGTWIGGLIVASAVLGLGAWAVTLMRRSGQSENPWKPTIHVLETGPYRFTRNPMYLQLVLVCIGVALILMNAWIIILVPVCIWSLQRFAIKPEEAYLERKFGDAYRDYKRRVRRWV